VNISKEYIIEWLERVWAENKAKGILAQVRFRMEFKRGRFSRYSKKYFKGCWVLSPKREDFYKTRFCFFVHDKILSTDEINREELEPEEILGNGEGLKFRMVSGFLNNAGLSVIYAIYAGSSGGWSLFCYDTDSETLRKLDARAFFEKWEGRGRPSRGRGWSDQLRKECSMLDLDTLVKLFLNEKFYTDYLKRILRIPISDPYDIDGFIISPQSRTVIPFEIKEKFPAERRGVKFFGIDAGRVLMLLRLCLPNDSNAFYIIREVDETPARKFKDWKFILLSEIIMSASWNLQRGGAGMGGQETQTVRLPYLLFKSLNSDALADAYLRSIGKLPDEVKKMAQQFRDFILKEFF